MIERVQNRVALLFATVILLLLITINTSAVETGNYRYYNYGADFNLTNWVVDVNGNLDTHFYSTCWLTGKNIQTNAQIFSNTPMLHDPVLGGLYYVPVAASNTTLWPQGKYEVMMSCTDAQDRNGAENISFIIGEDVAQLIHDTNSHLSQLIIDTNAIGRGMNPDQNALLYGINSLVAALPANIWNYGTRTLTDYNQSGMWGYLQNTNALVSDINGNHWVSAQEIWGYANRSISNFDAPQAMALLNDINATTKSINGKAWITPADVWNYTSKVLTDYNQSKMWNYLMDTNAVVYDINTHVWLSAQDVWNYNSRSLTDYNKQDMVNYLHDINSRMVDINGKQWLSAEDVWNYSDKRLTDYNQSALLNYLMNINAVTVDTNAKVWVSAQDVWNYTARNLTDYNQGAMLSLLNDINVTARDINGNSFVSAQDIWNYSVRTLTDVNGTNLFAYLQDINKFTADTNVTTANIWLNQRQGFKTVLSDFERIPNGGTYKAKLWVYDFNGVPIDADAAPKITLYDSAMNTVAQNIDMSRDETGIYSYSYTTSGTSPGGIWQASVSAQVKGATVKPVDFWELVGNPPEVKINSITDSNIPTITADVSITNEGIGSQEYQVEYCIVKEQNNQCGGGDDVDYASRAKLIAAGETWNNPVPPFTLNVLQAGTYWFKVTVHYGSETSAASKQFIATGGQAPPVNPSGGTGGGAAGGVAGPAIKIISAPDQVSVRQGGFAQFIVEAKNLSNSEAKNVSLAIDGMPLMWYSAKQSKNSLAPGETVSFVVKVNVPFGSDLKDYLMKIRVVSDAGEDSKDSILRVMGRETAEIVFTDLTQSELFTSGSGMLNAVIFNNSLKDLNLSASLLAPVEFGPAQEEFDFTLKAGEKRTLSFNLAAPQKGKAYEFVLTITSRDGLLFTGVGENKVSKELLVMVKEKGEFGGAIAPVMPSVEGLSPLLPWIAAAIVALIIIFGAWKSRKKIKGAFKRSPKKAAKKAKKPSGRERKAIEIVAQQKRAAKAAPAKKRKKKKAKKAVAPVSHEKIAELDQKIDLLLGKMAQAEKRTKKGKRKTKKGASKPRAKKSVRRQRRGAIDEIAESISE